MTLFLFTKKNILKFGTQPEFIILDEKDILSYNSQLNDFNNEGYDIITFDVEKLIAEIRKEKVLLKAKIIDISQLFKLIRGKPVKEFKSASPFLFDKILLYYKIYSKDRIEHLARGINVNVESLSNEDNLDILKGLKTAYNRIIQDSKELDEHERFFNLELPISQILYRREIKGIRVSTEKFQERLNVLDEIEYQSQNQLRYNYKIIDPNDSESLIPILKTNNLNFLADKLEKQNIDHLLKVGSKTNKLYELLYDFRKARRDKQFLFRFAIIDSDRIFPTYDCVGTVTSRILIKEPLIQQLRKSSRDVFIPDEGFEFLYADFGQFEPGILADKSGDEKLIELYNSGDIYEGLSNTVFGTNSFRSVGKILFLSYMYGMSIESLSSIVNDIIPNYSRGISGKLEKFFSEFGSLVFYKSLLEQELLANQRIGTSSGNYRYRTSSRRKNLLEQEKQWILSQKIQGTASFILKKAILNLAENKSIEFLIPMHDAALFQVPSNKIDKYKELIYKVFCDAFKNECPSINPKVHFTQFDE